MFFSYHNTLYGILMWYLHKWAKKRELISGGYMYYAARKKRGQLSFTSCFHQLLCDIYGALYWLLSCAIIKKIHTTRLILSHLTEHPKHIWIIGCTHISFIPTNKGTTLDFCSLRKQNPLTLIRMV